MGFKRWKAEDAAEVYTGGSRHAEAQARPHSPAGPATSQGAQTVLKPAEKQLCHLGPRHETFLQPLGSSPELALSWGHRCGLGCTKQPALPSPCCLHSSWLQSQHMHRYTHVHAYTHACMYTSRCVHTVGGTAFSCQGLWEEAKPTTDKHVLHPRLSLTRHIHFDKRSQYWGGK